MAKGYRGRAIDIVLIPSIPILKDQLAVALIEARRTEILIRCATELSELTPKECVAPDIPDREASRNTARIIPAPVGGGRVETGAIQFGSDWPGLFIRGDHAAYSALLLNDFLETGEIDFVSKHFLRGLVDDLRSCAVGPCKDRITSSIEKLRTASNAETKA